MPGKLFFRTDNPELYIEIERAADEIAARCVDSAAVPKWIKNTEGRSVVSPEIISEAVLAGTVGGVNLSDPVEFWEA